MARPTFAQAALALFDASGQQEIIRYIKTTPTGVIAADLNRDTNHLLPPGVFSIAGPQMTNDDDASYHILLALAFMQAGALLDMNLSAENYWPNLLVKTFKIDETYAQKLASDIDTVDDATGVGNATWLLSRILNWMPLVPDINANTIADDIDAPYEVLQAGEVFEKLLLRTRLSSGRALALLRPDLGRTAEAIREAIDSVQEGGDVFAIDRLKKAFTAIAPICVPMRERGQWGDWASTAADIQAGLNLAGSAVGLYQQIAQAAQGGQRPGQQGSSSGGGSAASPSGSATAGSGASSSMGGHVQVSVVR